MDPISNVDRLVLLLRQRLSERSRGGAGATRRDRAAAKPDAVRALDGVRDLDDRQLRRALVQNVLTDQFGAEMINEAQFQQMVDRVTETIEDDAAASALLGRLVAELRAAAR
jgi:hypothetical protein